jgi:hypothetical protein
MLATVGGATTLFLRGIIDAHQKVPGAPPGARCSRAGAEKILRPTADEQEASMKTLTVLAVIATAAPALAAGPAVPYPEGYRGWTHVKSMVIQQGHPLYEAFGGIHHIYANDKAMAGYRKGGVFADGAVIVFDLLDSKAGGGAIEEGARKVVGVMVKDAGKWKDTGGWGFEGFKGDSKTERAVGGNAKAACFECHTQVKAADHVFSRWRP